MPTRPLYAPLDALERSSQTEFEQQRDDAIHELTWPSLLDNAIKGLHQIIKPPAPLPIVVSPRPGSEQPQPVEMPQGQPDQIQTPTNSPQTSSSGTPAAMPTGVPAQSSVIASAGTRASRFANDISTVSREEGVPEDVLAAIIDTEDSGETSVSPAGARGITQVVPGQGFDLPGEDASIPLVSIRQAARALKEKYRMVGGDWAEAGRAYFGYGTDAGGMDTNTYGARYDQNRARYQGQGVAAQQRTPVQAEQTPAAQGQSPYNVAFGFNQRYDHPFNDAIPNHRGVDLVVPGAENNGRGSPVRAFQSGTVVAVTEDPNGGNGIILQDDQGLYHRYFHFDAMNVRQGQRVEAGQPIGVLGASGTEGFPHVHYEVSRGINGDPQDQLIDPTPYMQPRAAQNAPTTGQPPPFSAGTSAGVQPAPADASLLDAARADTGNVQRDALSLRQPLDPNPEAADPFSYESLGLQPFAPGDGGAAPQPAYDPREADQGAHEWSGSGASSGVGQNRPTIPYADTTTPTVTSQMDAGGPSARPQDIPTSLPNLPDPPPIGATATAEAGPTSQPTPPSGFPGLQAVYDSAGNFLHWIQGNMAQNRQNVEQANAATGYGQVTSTPGEPDYVNTNNGPLDGRNIDRPIPIPERQPRPPYSPEVVSDEEAANRASVAGMQPGQHLTTPINPEGVVPAGYDPGGADFAQLPAMAAEAGRQSLQRTIESGAETGRAASEGRKTDAALSAVWTAIQALNLPFDVAQEVANEILPVANVGGYQVGAGDVGMAVQIAHDLGRLAVHGVRIGADVVRQLKSGKTVAQILAESRVGQAVQSGARAASEAASGVGRRVGEGAMALGREGAAQLMDLAPSPRMAEGGPGIGRALADTANAAPTPPPEPAPTFYSQLRRTIEEKMPNRASYPQIQGILKGSAVKPDEIAWTGFDDWLREQRGPVTKQAALDFLDQNAVKVEEVVKEGKQAFGLSDPESARLDDLIRQLNRDNGLPPALDAEYRDLRARERGLSSSSAQPAKYGQYTLPGGENYRELLITKPGPPTPKLRLERDGAYWGIRDPETGKWWMEGESMQVAENYLKSLQGKADEASGAYRSSHWDEPNILAHVRFNERTAPDGARTLLIEEVQSDWHQAGRKQGYAGPVGKPHTPAEWDDLTRQMEDARARHGDDSPEVRALQDRATEWNRDDNVGAFGRGADSRVPDAPFKKTWPELAVKRMVRWAAENGFDRIAWPPGAVHAERYSLERHIDDLKWEREPSHWSDAEPMWSLTAKRPGGGLAFSENRVTADRMSNLIGQELAQRITAAPESTGRLTGLDLRTGGEGMKGFYDQILPATAQKIGKKFGARVGTSEIQIVDPSQAKVFRVLDQHGDEIMAMGNRQSADDLVRQAQNREPWQRVPDRIPTSVEEGTIQTSQRVHSMDITPEMKRSVMQEGQPLFVTPGISRSAGLIGDAANSLGGGVSGAAAGAALPADSDEERRQHALTGAGIGLVAGPVAGRVMPRTGGALATFGAAPGGPRRFANPADALSAAQAAIGTPNPRGPLTGLGKMEALRRWIVRNGTDNLVDVAELQKEAQRLLGRPLEADEMLTELTRANPSGAAKVVIDDAIRPALQDVGPERENLSTLMRLLNNTDVAAATGNPNRAFSGGLTGADSQAAAAHLWSTLTPEAQKALDTSSDALYRVVDHYRDEMVRAGVWAPELATDLKSKYPHWVPTKILDYMNDPATVSAGSKSISLRDRGLRAYTIDGTTKAAEDPIASLVRYVQDAESIIQKNETFNAFVNLRDRVPGWDRMIREVPSNTTPARANGEKAVTGFVNGERKTYMVPAPMAAAIQMEQGQQVPILRELTQVFKEFITRTPMFVAGQVPLDAFAYTVREAAREGGPLAMPRVVAELGKGYAEAFRGLLDGSFKGDAARYLKEGGAMAGFYERAADAASKTVDDLTRRHMFEVRNARDAKQLAGWLLGGGWVQAAGARVEMAPRVASFRLGEQRALRAGASAEKAALEGMTAGRDVTLDFQRGGVAAKVANQIIPFFNVGIQSATTLPRMIRENPKGAVTTMLSLVAAPTMAAEAWNRMDPQRSADYDDVPDYVKDRGIVVMLPGVEGKDERGERRPNYALIPMRELAPVAILARDLMKGAMGTSQRGPMATAQAILGAASPVQASGAADLFSSMLPPVASTGLQLAADSDFFRGGPIATTRRDEQASSMATGVANATGYRSSQVDFVIRDMFGGAGAMASAASDLATGKTKDEQRIQNAPLVGGMLSRFVGDSVGGNLTRAQDAMRTREVTRVLRDVGLRSDQLSPLDAKGPNDFPFTRQEQAKAQQLMNQYLAEPNGLANLPQSIPNWSALSQSAKQNIVRDAAANARKRAEGEVLSTIDERDRQRRFEQAAKKKAG